VIDPIPPLACPALSLTACSTAFAPQAAAAGTPGSVVLTQDGGGEGWARTRLRRIAALDDAGPHLDAVIRTNPHAPEEARAAMKAQRPLAGRTVLVKDNVETREWPTTAGSLALAGNMTGRDAPLVTRGLLGKTNLSEWANSAAPNRPAAGARWAGRRGTARSRPQPARNSARWGRSAPLVSASRRTLSSSGACSRRCDGYSPSAWRTAWPSDARLHRKNGRA